jgi:NADPH2:quinone reductase
VAPLPVDVDLLQLAALGLGAVTAYEGLRKVGPLAGRRVLVTGAAGGVGSAAIGIARAQGASVVAWVSRPEQIDYVRSLGADDVLVAARGTAPAQPAASVDGVLDTVAGAAFGRTVEALKPGGVLCLVGAVGGGGVSFDAWHLINPVSLTGYSSESLSGDELRSAMAAVCGWLASGLLSPPQTTTRPLAQAADAHRLLEAGGFKGRVLLVPD